MVQTKSRGFTLIEVMIVVAIIAILAAVAVPAYKDYIRRGQTQEAFTFLSDYRIKLEQYYQDNRAYGTGNCAAGGAVTPSWSFTDPNQKYFSYSCALTGTGGQSYTLTATGSSTSSVNGHVYTITNDGTKATTMFKGETTSKACWLSSGGEC